MLQRVASDNFRLSNFHFWFLGINSRYTIDGVMLLRCASHNVEGTDGETLINVAPRPPPLPFPLPLPRPLPRPLSHTL